MSLTHLPAVVDELSSLASAFAAAGHRVFLVGGVVRDLWLGERLSPGTDVDLTTDAQPDETLAVVRPLAEAVWTQGARFGTIGCVVAGREIEITTHRSEAYTAESRKPTVAFGDRIETDLSRRDFTVNAMAVELPDGALIDPFEGADDLRQHRLRTPIGAEQSFSDDPLRMLRAARFAARYALAPATEVTEAMGALASRLDIVAVERIVDELDKLLAVPDVSVGFELLHRTGLLVRLFPHLADRLDDGSVGSILAVLDEVPGADPMWRWDVLGWFGSGGDPGAVAEMASHLRLSRVTSSRMVRLTGAVAALDEASSGADADVRRWAFDAGDHRAEALWLGHRVAPEAAGALDGRIAALAASEDLDDPGVPLDGGDIMRLLSIGPGRRVGAALAHLRALRFERGPLDVDEAREALREWVSG